MTTEAALLNFASEFTLFLVALGCAAIVALGVPSVVESARARSTLAAGFVLLAAAAFLAGADVVADADEPVAAALRLIGLGLLAAELRSWHDVRTRNGLAGGFALVAVALGLLVADLDSASRWVQIGGSIVIGAAVITASRRGIAARIAASAAGTLLVVVIAVSLALSNVLVTNVEDEALRRAEARAVAEAAEPEDLKASALTTARSVAGFLQGFGPQLVELARGTAGAPAARNELRSLLNRPAFSFAFDPGPLLYVNRDTSAAAIVDQANQVGPVALVDLLGQRVVTEAIEPSAPLNGLSSVQVVGSSLFAIAAAPVAIANTPVGPLRVGAAVSARRLDRGYLDSRRIARAGFDEARDAGLALATVDSVLSRAGKGPPDAALTSVARRALGEARPFGTQVGDFFVVAAPITDTVTDALVAVVVSEPVAAITETRDDLFRSLFLVALLVALVAVVLAALVGSRIGSGIRRLTDVAVQMGEGELGARADVTSHDEVGVLGTAFNTMASSIATMTDDLRLAAEQEATLRGRLEAVVAGVGEALVAFDQEGQITDFNRAAEALTGVPARRARDRAVEAVVNVVGEGDFDVMARLRNGVPEAWSSPGVIEQAGGGRVPVLVSVGSVHGVDGEHIGTVMVLRDMRREREVEQMKTDFLSNISHELRTPLTPIKGYAGLLASRQVKPPEARRFGQVIQDSVMRVERLVDQLVDFATIAGGRLALRSEEQKVRAIVDDAVARWTARIPPTHKITRRVARGIQTVPVDRRYIDKALDELIDNAVKFSPDGGPVKISAEIVTHDGRRMVELAVVDAGVGIDHDRLEELTGEFIQGDPSATRRFGGLGVGLALVDRIVSAHNGYLSVQGRSGKGSKIAINLPIDDIGAKRARRPRSPTTGNRRRRVPSG